MVLVTPEQIESREQLDEFIVSNQKLEEFASQYGIKNIYQDSNLQQLQQALYLGLSFQPARQSNDAVDDYGCPWELKSLTLSKHIRGFSTSNPLSLKVLNRYRKCNFAFSIYENSLLSSIYIASPKQMKGIFDKFERRILTLGEPNNPKIPLDYVYRNAIKVYDKDFNDSVTLALYAPILLYIQAGDRHE